MRYKIQTLVDVTETGARRGDNLYQYKQQQNYLSLLNTISLRSNPIIVDQSNQKISLDGLGFGSKYKNRQQVWSLILEFESNWSHSDFFMKRDIEFVPIITGLNETAKFPNQCFLSSGEYTNIIFSLIV